MSMANVLDGITFERSSTAQQVAGTLRDVLLRGELRPGTPLRELALASSLGVSRNTIREALRMLAADGLVRYAVHRRVAVAALTERQVVDIFKARRMIEREAVACARTATPGR